MGTHSLTRVQFYADAIRVRATRIAARAERVENERKVALGARIACPQSREFRRSCRRRQDACMLATTETGGGRPAARPGCYTCRISQHAAVLHSRGSTGGGATANLPGGWLLTFATDSNVYVEVCAH